jgi:pimeloyl-ACP methyl ester carboxylesterase
MEMLVRLTRLFLIAGACGAAFALATCGRAAYSELRSDFYAPRQAVPSIGEGNLPDASSIELHTPLADIRGWYLAPRNGAAVVLVHGTSGNRLGTLTEARILAHAGYGVLLFDWPGSGESTGKTAWGAGERAALRAALDFAEKQPGVLPGRIGVFGFSMGTLIAVQVAAVDTRVGALFVTGAFGDPDPPLAHQFQRWGPFSARGAVWGAHLGGMDLEGQRPKDIAHLIAPRPLFIVAGSDDDVIPPDNARALYDSALEPRTLWIVAGAHHGDYAEVGGSEYAERIISFFDRALLLAGQARARD